MNETATPNNGKTLNWPTLILVLLSGGVNLMETKSDGNLTREEAQRVASEIHDLHRRQQEIIDGQNRIWRAIQNRGNPNYNDNDK